MTPPPNIAYNTAKLRDDAKLWDNAATVMAKAEATVKGLHLGEFSFGYLANRAGLTAAYETLRQTMETWAKQGHDNFADGAAALRETADAYDSGEQKSIDKIKDAWHL